MRNHNIKALVTGSAGFIGKHLCSALRKHPDVQEVIEFDIADRLKWDIRNVYHVEQHIGLKEPDIVFHLASTTTVPYYKQEAYGHIHTNVNGTQYILENCPRGCRFVFASSVAVYGETYSGQEEDVPHPKSLYAASKLAAENLIKSYTNMGLVDGISLRLTSVVGKDMTHGCLKDFINKIKGESKELSVWGKKPGTIRPFIHVSDVVRALIYFGIDLENNIETVNITTDKPYSIEDVALATLSTMKSSKNLCWENHHNMLGDVQVLNISSYLARYYGFHTMDSYDSIIKAIEENI